MSEHQMKRPVQRRNRYGITVRFPASYDQLPELAGTVQTMWYPTAEAADLAGHGFGMQGCEWVPGAQAGAFR